MTTMKKRLLSTFLVLCMLCPMLPTTVFAADESVTITTKYVDVTGDVYKDLDELTITDTDEITLDITVYHQNQAANLTIDIPVGLMLVTANGYSATGTDYHADSYNTAKFAGFPTWTPDNAIAKTTASGTTAAPGSGTLVYPMLSTIQSTDFEITLKADPAFIAMNDDNDNLTTLLGNVTASLNIGSNATDSLAVSATSLQGVLQFTTLTAKEYLPTALSTSPADVSESSLMIDGTSVMRLSTAYTLNRSMDDTSYALRAHTQSFVLTLPKGAKLTAISSCTSDPAVGTATPAADGTTSYTITVTGAANFSSNISLANFATVDFSGATLTADAAQSITLSDLTVSVDQYNPGTSGFVAEVFESTTDQTLDIAVVDKPVYAITYGSSSGNVEELDPGTDEPQVLFSASRKASGSVSDATLNSWTPVTFTYTANQMAGAYLDTVSQVVMSVPFLSDGDPATSDDPTLIEVIPRHVSQLTSLTVRYEDAPTTDVVLTLTNYTIDLTSSASNITSIQLDTSGIAVYNATSSPTITFTSPTNKSLIYIEAVFTGDNDTLYSGNSAIVYGLPKDDDPSETYSNYTFSMSGNTSETVPTTSAVTGGFRWEEPTAFALTVSSTSVSNQNYMYNTAKENTISVDSSRTSNYQLYGYHDLGSYTLENKSGSDTTAPITFTFDIDTTNDIVKEIYFPLYAENTTGQVESLSYTLTDGTTVEYTKGDASIPFETAAEDSTASMIVGSSSTQVFGIVRAEKEGDVGFASLTVTLSNWGLQSTVSYAKLRGYVSDTNILSRTDTHTLTISNADFSPDPYAMNSTFQSPAASPADLRILSLGSLDSDDSTYNGNITATEVGVGLTTFVDFTIMGGWLENIYNGSLKDIAFNVVLPEGVTLVGATTHDWTYGYSTNSGLTLNDYANSVTTTEEAGDITRSVPTVINDSAILNAHYEKASVSSANVYTCTLDDDVNLYALRIAGTANTLTMFTVSLELHADITATPVVIPWSEVLILGSTDSNDTLTEANSGDWGQGSVDTTPDATFTAGISSKSVITANESDDQYLAITSDSQVMVNDGYVTMDSDDTDHHYRYNEADAEATTPVFGSGESGELHFSVTNMQDQTVIDKDYTTSYVLFALPYGDANELKPTNEFSVASIGTHTIDISNAGSNVSVTAEYVTIPSGTIGVTEIEALVGDGASEWTNQNGLLLTIKGQDRTTSIDVTIPFTMPTGVENTALNTMFEGRSTYVYNESGHKAIYYGGLTEISGTPVQSTDNYLMLSYYHPTWTVDFNGVDEDGAAVTLSTIDATVENNALVTEPTAPTVSGYSFEGWYTDDTLTTSFDFATAITADTTIYAKMIANGYTVSYAYETGYTGTKTPDADTVGWSDTLTLPTASDVDIRTGYTFDGWYDAASGGSQVSDGALYSSFNDHDGITLYAYYTSKTYTITYDLNYTGAVNTTVDSTYFYDDLMTGLATPTRTGYTFDGWSKTTTGTVIDSSKTYGEIFGDMATSMVYGQWTENTYTVSFNADGGTACSDLTVNWTDSFTGEKSLPTTTKEGYTFAGWYNGTTLVSDGDAFNIAVGATATLTAEWTENTYTLTLDYADGTTPNATAQYLWTAAIDLSTTPTRDGYTFSHWQDADGDTIADAALYSAINPTAANQTLTAQWTAKEYTITFDLVNGTSGTTTTMENVKWTDVIDLYDDASLAGYDFINWYMSDTADSTGNRTYILESDISADNTFENLIGVDSSTIALYAHFVVKTHYVEYYDGATLIKTEIIDSDEAVPVADYEVDGYTFVGWYKEEGFTTQVTSGTHLTNFGNLDDDSTTKLYAKMTENSYNVVFNDNNGNATYATTPFTWTASIAFPAEPTRDGYTFTGWYRNADGITNQITAGTTFGATFGSPADTTDRTVYAGWSQNSYTVTWVYANDATPNGTDTYTWDETISLPSTPTRTGYDFDGWTNEDTNAVTEGAYYYSAIGNTNVLTATVTAQWLEKTFTPLYDLNGAAGSVTGNSVAWTGTIDHPTAPTRAGYTFSGWYTTSATTTQVLDDAVVYNTLTTDDTTAITLYAKWDQGNYTITFLNTGAGSAPTSTGAWTDDVSFPTPVQSDFVFDGWYKDDGTAITSSSFSSILIDDTTYTMDLYAHWNEVEPVATSDVSTGTISGLVANAAYTVNGTDYTADGNGEIAIISSWYSSDIFIVKVDSNNDAYTDDSVPQTLTIAAKPSSGGSYSSSSSSTTTAETTASTENHFAYMYGYTDGSFGIYKNITRAEASVLFARLLSYSQSTTTSYSADFSDVSSDAWYADELAYLQEFGIIEGYSDGTFRGSNSITRAEFSAILCRFESLATGGTSSFSDVADSYWATGYISAVSAQGWMVGYADGTFCPTQYITRSEAVTAVNRMLERICDQDYATTNSDELTQFTDVDSTFWAYWDIMEATNGHNYTRNDDETETWTSLTD